MPSDGTLLYFCPNIAGGIADYARYQIRALAALGVKVTLLTGKQWRRDADEPYTILPLLDDSHLFASIHHNLRRLDTGLRYLRDFHILKKIIKQGKFNKVLLASYVEYLAPLWSRKFTRLMKNGVKFAAIMHDPVRDYIVGPLWWHRRSIAAGYSFLHEAFVHEEIRLDTGLPMPRLRTTVIPHGPYHFPNPTQSRDEMRKKLSIPDEAFVLLSFGHIRDGKNLDLVIRAMADLPSVYLVVAGKEQSSAQKPIGHYQALARTIGVQDRCRWIHGHVPETEIGNLFAGADGVLLTYSKNFRSASGVLNAAITYRKLCLASSGGGNLRSVVEHYGLGWFVAPDDLAALKVGIQRAANERIKPRWNDYESENSWERNARLVKERMFDLNP